MQVIDSAVQTKLHHARQHQRDVLTSTQITTDIIDYFRKQAKRARKQL